MSNLEQFQKEKLRILARAWYHKNKERRKIAAKKYYEANKDKATAYQRKYLGTPKDLARRKVRNAVALGKFEKMPCEVCDNKKSQFHHTNGYEGENVFVGRWLCSKHHADEHLRIRELERASKELVVPEGFDRCIPGFMRHKWELVSRTPLTERCIRCGTESTKNITLSRRRYRNELGN